ILGNENRRAGRGARMQRLMCLARVGQRKALMDRDPDRARGDRREEIVGGLLQLLGGARVVAERRPRQVERALALKMPGSKAGTAPDELPKLTSIPRTARLSSEPANVSLPIES